MERVLLSTSEVSDTATPRRNEPLCDLNGGSGIGEEEERKDFRF